MLRQFLELLFPPRCLVCAGPGPEVLCARCRAGFQAVRPPICRRCGGPIVPSTAGGPCAECRWGDVAFAAARSPALYAGSLRVALHRFKFDGRSELGPPLGILLADFVRQSDALGHSDVVVPVPLHPTRERARGFNHAALLAAPVAEVLGVPLCTTALERVVPTPPQSTLTGRQRRASVRGAFRVPPVRADIVHGQAILLVDDVLTSGATASECARTLLSAGAKAVRVATLARAVLAPREPAMLARR